MTRKFMSSGDNEMERGYLAKLTEKSIARLEQVRDLVNSLIYDQTILEESLGDDIGRDISNLRSQYREINNMLERNKKLLNILQENEEEKE